MYVRISELPNLISNVQLYLIVTCSPSRLGQLQVGDQVLAINGVRMDGVTLQQAIKLVQEASDLVEMEVMFNVNDAIVPTSGTFEVTMQRTSTLTLGITINGWRFFSLSLSHLFSSLTTYLT